ncbi:ATP12 family chaperone protein [Inquilinus sp. Marseille-Q2685]|uniref:ATP12 family chaperone protein n=1 Tax=Inquilinus sp. Marseille-Q2685 TaxID=2866581 RepID=UPI001CE3E90D|nr:ATP12 family protein [Inquilinus sp. Marseille-Q2685]
MKRFYKTVGVVPAGGGFGIALDGKPIKSPAKAEFVLPSRALAEAVAAEWEAQTEEVVPSTMPLMQLAATAIDKVAPNRQLIIDTIAPYGGTDLLCYRAEAPAALAQRQATAWQPLLDWAMTAHDAPLTATSGIVHQAQPESSLAALRAAVAAQDDWRLTALHQATALTGSLVLGLALLAGRIDADEAFELAELDASFQIERWGEDAEAAARRAALRAELQAAARLVELAMR